MPLTFRTMRRLLWVAVGLAALALMTLYGLQRARTERLPHATAEPDASVPILGAVADFALTNQAGNGISRADLSNCVWVADFIFTSCPGACPVMTRHLRSVHDAFRDDARVRFVSVSVDPARDTPTTLAAFAAQYEADPSRWHFLTGPADALQALSIGSFKMGNPENPLDHSTRFALVDRRFRIRGYYDGMEASGAARLAGDIRRLLDAAE